MGRKDSARGPFAERCFLAGPFRSAASADAPLCNEAFSSSLVQVDAGLPALQLRFLAISCLAGACAAGLAAGDPKATIRIIRIITDIDSASSWLAWIHECVIDVFTHAKGLMCGK